MIRKDTICLGNELCPKCGRQLAKFKKLVMTENDTLVQGQGFGQYH